MERKTFHDKQRKRKTNSKEKKQRFTASVRSPPIQGVYVGRNIYDENTKTNCKMMLQKVSFKRRPYMQELLKDKVKRKTETY
jgi:hypothetical protein